MVIDVYKRQVCSKPPMLTVSIRKSRLSHAIISATGEFTVNLVGEDLCRAMDYCGVKSGRDVDKFAELKLHAVSAPELSAAPGLAEAPAFLSCRVSSVSELGTHDLFLADILQVSVAERFFTKDVYKRQTMYCPPSRARCWPWP